MKRKLALVTAEQMRKVSDPKLNLTLQAIDGAINSAASKGKRKVNTRHIMVANKEEQANVVESLQKRGFKVKVNWWDKNELMESLDITW